MNKHPPPISVLVTSLHTYLPHCYVSTDVPLLGDPEVSFLVHAMLVFVRDLLCHTQLFVVWFQSRRLQTCSVWTVFVLTCSTGQAFLHFLAWLTEIDKPRTNDVFEVRNVRLRICHFIEAGRHRFHFPIYPRNISLTLGSVGAKLAFSSCLLFLWQTKKTSESLLAICAILVLCLPLFPRPDRMVA